MTNSDVVMYNIKNCSHDSITIGNGNELNIKKIGSIDIKTKNLEILFSQINIKIRRFKNSETRTVRFSVLGPVRRNPASCITTVTTMSSGATRLR